MEMLRRRGWRCSGEEDGDGQGERMEMVRGRGWRWSGGEDGEQVRRKDDLRLTFKLMRRLYRQASTEKPSGFVRGDLGSGLGRKERVGKGL
eukprot:560261-Pleurochrysis_carterae.AAC.1